MTSRTTPRREYIKLTDQLEAALRKTICSWCGTIIGGREGAHLDHRDMVEISGDNSPDNLQWMHADPCHKEKTKLDAARLAKTKRQFNKHNGIETRRKKPINSRGFDKTKTRGFDGKVRERT